MKEKSPYKFYSQYQQSPTTIGGAVFLEDYWKFYKTNPKSSTLNPELPPLEYRFITADTAMKTGIHNDYSVFQHWGYANEKIYLLNQQRGKWNAVDLNKVALKFWQKKKAKSSIDYGDLRNFYIEDKSSGTGLIDFLNHQNIPVEAIPRTTDKFVRAGATTPYISAGKVILPEAADWLQEFLQEFNAFNPDKSYKHDDQIDPLMDAVDIALIESNNVELMFA